LKSSKCLELTTDLSVSLLKLNLTKLKYPKVYHKSSSFLKFSSSSSLFSEVWPKHMQ